MSYPLTTEELSAIATAPAAGDSTEALLAKLAAAPTPQMLLLTFGGSPATVTIATKTARCIRCQCQSGTSQFKVSIAGTEMTLAAGKDWEIASPNGLPFIGAIIVTALAGTVMVTQF